ncbi:uncharacterized protein LOC121951858 [Plectropomus leopardus]|uniref:uncharacterized protein LOC121951858 n=1 Tax=Plectropomus leopardus TaxID=160734 RepID=UPI001C4ACAD6|nr:uncharacterized protein LOC121951858 [Plectropomus leopardus]
MRPSSRQRVAAWLLALPLGRGGEECARRGRLEMISFWLLCWKLLRATAGLRRTTPELTDGNHDNSSSGNDNPVNDSPTPVQPTDPVTMEISSSPPLTDLERENLVSWRSQEVGELHYPEVHGVQQPIGDKQEEEETADKENGKRDGDECDYLVFEIGEKKGEGKGDESEGGQDTERGGEEGEDGEGIEIDGKEDGSGETEREDGGRENTKEENGWLEETVGEVKDDSLSELLFISDSSVCPSSSEPLTVTSQPSEQPAAGVLHDTWGHDLSNRDDLSDTHLSDCLQAELAIVKKQVERFMTASVMERMRKEEEKIRRKGNKRRRK